MYGSCTDLLGCGFPNYIQKMNILKERQPKKHCDFT